MMRTRAGSCLLCLPTTYTWVCITAAGDVMDNVLDCSCGTSSTGPKAAFPEGYCPVCLHLYKDRPNDHVRSKRISG